MNKVYAIGDIHGRFDMLSALMDKVNIDYDTDLLVFLGDYIDRGPDSFQVVDYLVNLKKRHADIVFLKGNHEEMLDRYLTGKDRLTFLYNGGQQTLDSYMRRPLSPDMPLIPTDHLDFFQSLQLYYETEEYIFVHAGLKKRVPLHKQKPDDLLWIRKKFIDTKYNFGKPVVFGHTPLPEPLLQQNKIGIDTGAVYGNKLTCVQLPDMVFYDVHV